MQRGRAFHCRQMKDPGKVGERFDNVLNRPSSINEEAINRLNQIDNSASLALVPTLDEVNAAIASLSNGKAPGSDGLPPEIFATGGPSLVAKLLELFQAMWRREELVLCYNMYLASM